jgi:hypothetical protein
MVSDVMAAQAPPELLAIHITWPFMVLPDIDRAIQTGSPPPSDLSAEERRACERPTGIPERDGMASFSIGAIRLQHPLEPTLPICTTLDLEALFRFKSSARFVDRSPILR